MAKAMKTGNAGNAGTSTPVRPPCYRVKSTFCPIFVRPTRTMR